MFSSTKGGGGCHGPDLVGRGGWAPGTAPIQLQGCGMGRVHGSVLNWPRGEGEMGAGV